MVAKRGGELEEFTLVFFFFEGGGERLDLSGQRHRCELIGRQREGR